MTHPLEASDEADDALDERVLCVSCGQPAVGKCICAAPPTQGEEETAREIAVKVIPDTVIYVADLRLKAEPVIYAALRQRADEATEAAEHMRWKTIEECEAIARKRIGLLTDYDDDWSVAYRGAARIIADEIAALKDKP